VPRGRLRVVLVAEESAGVQALEALRKAPESPEIVAVVTSTETEGSRRPLVAAGAARLDVDVRPASELRRPSFAGWIRDQELDLLLNVHSLSVLDPEVIAAPAIGSFNLHPGPLPEYAGLNAPSWAIFRGEPIHGVTLHWMDAGIDTGPIAYRSVFDLDDLDTGLSATGKCLRHGVPLVSRLVGDASHDASSIPALEQDLHKRRYFGPEVPNGGNVGWSAPAREIVRFVRAADYTPFNSPWGIPRAQFDGRPVGIAKASATGEPTDETAGSVGQERPRGSISVAAADEWIAVDRMWRDGRYVRPCDVCSVGDRLQDGESSRV
jgi:methionyl-tRNA formyltransferase